MSTLLRAPLIYISDTLDLDFETGLYHDVGQKIVFNQSVKKRYDYRCSLSDTMPAFLMLRDQLRLVVLGDSRGFEGVRADLFYGEENRTEPIAYNLSVTSAPLELQDVLVKEYLLSLPKLEWVVYQMSPRVVNRYYRSSKCGALLKSPGYRCDQEYGAEMGHPWAGGGVKVAQLATTPYVARRWKAYPWGWKQDDDTWDNPRFRKSGTHWEISRERWDRLEAMLKALEERGVKVLLYLSPIHPVIRRASHVDDDGTTREGYEDLVQRLEELAREVPNLVFVDLLQGGNHSFGPGFFGDLDHLNKAGATKLTHMLETIRTRR